MTTRIIMTFFHIWRRGKRSWRTIIQPSMLPGSLSIHYQNQLQFHLFPAHLRKLTLHLDTAEVAPPTLFTMSLQNISESPLFRKILITVIHCNGGSLIVNSSRHFISLHLTSFVSPVGLLFLCTCLSDAQCLSFSSRVCCCG